MNQPLRLIRGVLRGGDDGIRRGDVFRSQSRAYDHATILVKLFYAANLLTAGWRLAERDQWNAYASLYPLWPLFWAEGMEVSRVATIVLTANAVFAAAAAIFPAWGITRWLAFAGLLLAGAFENSFGRIGHSEHAWIWVALFFAMLPGGSLRRLSASRVLRQRVLQLFWTAQFAVLFFYSMSGWLKLVPVPIQLLRGEVCSLAPEALARHVASRVMETQSQPLLAEWAVDYLWLSWPLYVGAIYLEAAAVLIAFRPTLQRAWGSALVLLHLGIGLTMEIWFVTPMFLLALLFINSPFQRREKQTWRATLWLLPGLDVLHWCWRRTVPAHRDPLVEKLNDAER